MYEGKVKGIFAFGMNGVMIGPDSNKNIDALKKADWLVVCEIYPDETSEFWRAPGITAEDQKKINTTVYRLPGQASPKKTARSSTPRAGCNGRTSLSHLPGKPGSTRKSWRPSS